MAARPGSKTKSRIWVVERGQRRTRPDHLATEEPLEIRLQAGQQRQNLAVTMRTPGADFDLAAGFLYSEGVITQPDDIYRMRYCVDGLVDAAQHYNTLNVELRQHQLPDLVQLERHFYTSSACGVCGKASIDALRIRECPALSSDPVVPTEVIYHLPEQLRSDQGLFATTGGLHAAGLFTADGHLLAVREDVGRHNALDKLIGWALLQRSLPLSQHIIMVSGRASFEIMQKCLVAGVPIVCAVSAPSSLAVTVARSFGMTLIGFLRGERFNVYAGIERIQPIGTAYDT